VQRMGLTHQTPARFVECAPGASFVGWSSQLVPSQRSTIDWLKPVCPTAVHATLLAHETDERKSSVEPGVGSTIQLVPSQRSASAPPAFVDAAAKLPTAVQ